MGEGWKVILTMWFPFALVVITALGYGLKKEKEENEQKEMVQAIKRSHRSEREIA